MMNSDRALRLILFTVVLMTMVGLSLLWQNKAADQLPQANTTDIQGDKVSGANALSTTNGLVINSLAAQAEAYQVPQVEKLRAFQGIQDKVFASNEEEQKRKNLLRDRALIEDLGAFLTDRRRFNQTADQSTRQMEKDQDSAVDFLLAALKDGDKEFAENVILNVIKDSQVEDSTVSMEQRQMLASLKGELLFHGSAIRPDGFQNIASVLPGPVSLRIWQNVQARQSQYAEESMVEKVAHDQKFGM